jgi:hypothetical protein
MEMEYAGIVVRRAGSVIVQKLLKDGVIMKHWNWNEYGRKAKTVSKDD